MTIRKKFIIDMVAKYKKDYPEEFQKFQDFMDFKRSEMADKKLGKIGGASEMRVAGQLPDRLANMFAYVFDGVTEPRLFEPRGEMKWFMKKFPEFLLPMSY